MNSGGQPYHRSENNTFKIKVVKNGPYIVSGGIPLATQRIVLDADGQCLEWRETEKYSYRKNYSLCRCGKTKRKPFCDQSHKDVGFDGTETAGHKSYLDQCAKYTGPAVDLTDALALCSDAGFCERAGGIWDLVLHSENPEARKKAIEEGRACPSGRLVIWDKKGNSMEPDLEPSIGLVELPDGEFTGSIWVRGGIPVESADGETYEIRNRVTLCGCGKSSNKPFCDGAHRGKKSG